MNPAPPVMRTRCIRLLSPTEAGEKNDEHLGISSIQPPATAASSSSTYLNPWPPIQVPSRHGFPDDACLCHLLGHSNARLRQVVPNHALAEMVVPESRNSPAAGSFLSHD